MEGGRKEIKWNSPSNVVGIKTREPVAAVFQKNIDRRISHNCMHCVVHEGKCLAQCYWNSGINFFHGDGQKRPILFCSFFTFFGVCFDGSQGIEGNDEEMDAVSTPVSITPIFLRVVMGGTPNILPMRPGGNVPDRSLHMGEGTSRKSQNFPENFRKQNCQN